MTTTAPPDEAAVAPQPATGAPNRRRLLLGVGAALVVVGLVGWLVAFSSVLGVRTVRVQGLHVLRAADVRAAAAVTMGRPLIRLDTGAIVRRVEQLPAVKSARVDTSYPGTVTIRVTERTAVGYLEDGARFVLVDADGVQYRSVPAHPARLPLFAVPSGPPATAAAHAVAGVAADLGPGLLGRVASIQAFDPNAITLLLTDHRVVHWGSAARSADKARILPTLLTQPGTQFDVSNPDQVVVR